jgi:eukaryotic-like serine/threonine-protein kinase
MSDERWRRIDALFHEARARPAAEWPAFVREHADDGIARELLALLDAHQTRSPLLDAPPVGALPTGMRLGPYAIDRLLGSGGMATVYLAYRADRQFDKQVAIKLVNHGLAAELTGDRFELERRILARLEHPNVARLLDAGLSDFGQPFLVMEWVDGVPLDEWRRAINPSLVEQLDLWQAIASAVAYAHRNLVVHRDLKPSNVLVTADGTPKLVDFGIARLIGGAGSDSTTRTQHFTPLYASPEQLRGRAVNTSTDVFGLGVLLAELVSGGPPFGGPGRAPHEQARAVLEDEPAIAPTVPGDIAAIVRMALRKEPERRYASADQMADDVRRYLRGWPVTARPESWGYRARRFVGRNRIASVLVATSAIGLIGATGVALRQARAADDQRARAEQVTGFLTGFLGGTSGGPGALAVQNRGVSLRVVELADLMGSRLGSEFSNQPEAEATLRSVLTMSYFQMGEMAKAQEHAERAISLYDQLYPRDDQRRLPVEILLGAVEVSAGAFARAEQRLTDAASRWPRAPLADRAALATQLGVAQLRLGKLDNAEDTLRRGISSVEQEAGPRHPTLTLVASNLSLVLQDRGRFAEAAQWLERAADISRASFTGTSMSLGWVLVNLANVYRFQGEIDKSLAAATESLAQFEGALGPTHVSTIHPLAAIAYAKAAKGEPDAESFIRRGLANQTSLPDDHYERAVGLNYLGFVLMKAGRLTEARDALERALAIRRRVFPSPNWRISETASWLGEVLALQGLRDPARVLLEESASTFAALYGDENQRTREARERLARLSR